MMSRGCDTPNATVYNRIAAKTPSPLENYQVSVMSTPSNFKTPGKYTNSPGPKYKKNGLTPKNLMATPHRNRTPSGPLYNPFDDGNLETMHLPTFSPNVFKVTSTPSSSQKTPAKSAFRWSIDQQAILYPADIDEMPHHQDALVSQLHDDRKEEEVQNAIDTFFSSNLIVPSPWTETSTSRSRIQREPEKDKSSSQSSKDSSLGTSQDNSQAGAKKDMACQTTLTLPAGFDLQALLAEHFTYTQQNESTEMLSTSTLRRKLFCQGDQPASLRPGSTDCRMPEYEDRNMAVDSPLTSPMKYTTPCRRRSPAVTPASAQFSSSPIRKAGARSSTCAPLERLSSPELSPISTPMSKRSSPGRCGVQLQFTPSSDHHQSIVLASPDISPIKFEDSFDDTEASSPGFVNHEDKATASSSPSEDHAETDVYRRRDTIEMCFEAPEILGATQNMDIDLSACDNVVLEQEPRLGNWGLSIIRECSDSAERTNLDMGSSVTFTTMSQDTGYQTASLQLTNQEAGMLHTDLTQQMGSLPLCSVSDINNDNDCLLRLVDDSGLSSYSTSRGFESNKENMYSESNFQFGSFNGKVKSSVLSENCGGVFPCSKEHKPLLQVFPINHDSKSVAGSFEMCHSGGLPRMIQSESGIPLFSWDPASV